MRVIIVTWSNNRSGGTRQAVYQARGLSERGHDVTLCLPHDSSLWELPGMRDNPLWRALPAEESRQRAFIEGLFPSDPATPTIVHAFHNKAVKRMAWWGLFWRHRALACVAHRGVIFRPGNPLPYLSPAMKAFIPNSEACARAIAWCSCPRPAQFNVQSLHISPAADGLPQAVGHQGRHGQAVLRSGAVSRQLLVGRQGRGNEKQLVQPQHGHGRLGRRHMPQVGRVKGAAIDTDFQVSQLLSRNCVC